MTNRRHTYCLTESDAVAAARLALRRRLWSGRGGAMAAVYSVLVGLLAVLMPPGLRSVLFLAALAAIPLALSLMWWWLAPALARGNYRQSAGLKAEATLSWDEDGFAIAHRHGSVQLPWAEVAGVLQEGDRALLYQSDQIYNLVSLAGMTAEQRTDWDALSVRANAA